MQGASQTLASPGPLSRDPALCQEGAAQVNIYIIFTSYIHRCNFAMSLYFLRSKIRNFDTRLSQGVSKCPMGGAALHTQSSGLSPVRQVRSNF